MAHVRQADRVTLLLAIAVWRICCHRVTRQLTCDDSAGVWCSAAQSRDWQPHLQGASTQPASREPSGASLGMATKAVLACPSQAKSMSPGGSRTQRLAATSATDQQLLLYPLCLKGSHGCLQGTDSDTHLLEPHRSSTCRMQAVCCGSGIWKPLILHQAGSMTACPPCRGQFSAETT